jgi:hypothetical protein
MILHHRAATACRRYAVLDPSRVAILKATRNDRFQRPTGADETATEGKYSAKAAAGATCRACSIACCAAILRAAPISSSSLARCASSC